LLAGCRKGDAQEISAFKPGAPEPAAQSTAPEKPEVKGQQSWDFGRIPASAPVSHEFVWENKGTKELKVQGRTASCGCTTSQIDKETIPPGDKAKLTVTFDPRGYAGQVKQFVYANTDDPETPIFSFIVTADVIP
jgi:hypothetical protein